MSVLTDTGQADVGWNGQELTQLIHLTDFQPLVPLAITNFPNSPLLI